MQTGAIARYQVSGQLPPIAGAEVFLARAQDSNEQVVLRMLRKELSANPDLVNAFVEQAVIAQKVTHDSLARVLEIGRTAEGRPWVVTEYFSGEDLGQHLTHHPPLSSAEVIRLGLTLCEVLRTAHLVGVVHGALKPASVFLCRGLPANDPRLLDLGLSHFDGDPSYLTDPATLPYVAPEVASGARPDVRTDVFGFGVLLHEALTGKPPFRADTLDELGELQSKPPPRLTGSNAQLAAVVEQCLERKPADRYPDFAHVAAALRTCRLPSTMAPNESHPGDTGGDEEEVAPEKPGDLLGSYQLVRLIGQGSMSRVYLAQHTKLGRQVALKVLRTSLTRSRSAVQRFFQEARTVNQINHEHIVEVFDFVEELTPEGLNLVYCVMELLAGASLAQTMTQQKLSLARMIDITGQVCSALGAAHQVGVVHRDLKPDNIFLTTRAGVHDFVKVLDFGVAKVTVPVAALKASGAIVGTPTYLSPEQASDTAIDARSDLYAVGTLVYEMICGRPPFEAATFGQLAAQVISRAPPPLPDVSVGGERVPPGLKAEILKALEKDPRNRQPTALAFAEGLARCQEASDTLGARLRKNRIGLAIGAVGALALTAAVLASRNPPAPAEPPPPPRAVLLPVLAPSRVVTTVKLTVGSDPPGAEVIRLDTGAVLGVTPLTQVVPRADADVSLSLRLEGYRPAERAVRLDANTALDIALEKVAPQPAAKPSNAFSE